MINLPIKSGSLGRLCFLPLVLSQLIIFPRTTQTVSFIRFERDMSQADQDKDREVDICGNKHAAGEMGNWKEQERRFLCQPDRTEHAFTLMARRWDRLWPQPDCVCGGGAGRKGGGGKLLSLNPSPYYSHTVVRCLSVSFGKRITGICMWLPRKQR